MPNPNFTAYFVAPPIAPQCMYIKCVYIYVYLVFRKERLGERPMQRASRDALGTFFKKSIFFYFSGDAPHFSWKKATFSDFFPSKAVQTRLFPQKSRKNPDFRRISAIFAIFPKKKRPGHWKSVSGSVPEERPIERASRDAPGIFAN